ncbi:MAG TPA: MFS transporter, partial [Pseudonocardiaceae bacterium]
VFPKVFFPALGSTVGTVASFATSAVAFIARPVGAVGFGHYGDRIDRKRTLISTLLLMGFATVLIGLLPGAATIGIAAPILLVVLRFAQGLAVGGEWAGATLLTAEYAPQQHRGRNAMSPSSARRSLLRCRAQPLWSLVSLWETPTSRSSTTGGGFRS